MVKLEVPFTAYDQLVELQVDLGRMVDYRGRTLRARVKLDAGLTPVGEPAGGATMICKSGADWSWGGGAWQNLGPDTLGTWQTLEFDLDAPRSSGVGFDPSQLRTIAIQVSSGSGVGATAPPSPALVYIDWITVTGGTSNPGTGGASGVNPASSRAEDATTQ